ncbi:TonB-dependent receptor [Aliarcobacter butzleri]|uniref:TonB-dependent siderophore receptor n=1 Tax=Aliarcobacter butzleri TaxID=28197 RepID=UPI001EDAC13A|nr:TonB-dependent receptor [Aliarcobacter butzleri]MCG3687822.1 TonB-dependent receptor [Aliarcobacter butzleri]MCG3703743.1 TonB-dependent receptor [Aliarcobacter butzleri]MDS1370580.1 TonB-dependent receptor [Aliarcobacter butzleri]
MSLLKKSLIAPSLAILLATNLYSANYTVDTTNATKAIEKISELSNIPFIVDTNILNGKNTNKIQNVQNLDEALKLMFEGTGLEAVVKNNTIVIKKIEGKGTVLEPISVNESYKNGSSENGYLSEDITGVGLWGKRSLQDTPYSMSVIPQELIENVQAKDMNQIFKMNPTTQETGQMLTGLGDAQWVTIRGFEINNPIINGIPYSTKWASTPMMQDIERVEIINGATGFLYGGGRVGGAVNYITKKPTTEDLRNVSIGSYGNESYYTHLDLGGQFDENHTFGYRVNTLYQNGELPNESDKEQKAISLVFDWKPTDNFYTDIKYSYKNSLEKGGNFYFRKVSNRKAIDKSKGFSPDWIQDELKLNKVENNTNWNINDTFTLRTSLMYEKTKSRGSDINASIVDNTVISSLSSWDTYIWKGAWQETENYGGNIFLDSNFDTLNVNHNLTIGYSMNSRKHFTREDDGHFYRFNGNVSLNDIKNLVEPDWDSFGSMGTKPLKPSTKSEYQNILIGDDITFNDQWSALVGANYATVIDRSYRADTKYDESKLTPTLSLIFKPFEQLTTYTTYIESLEAGTIVGDRYKNEGQILAPYKSKQYEIGTKYSLFNEKVLLNGSLFRIEKANEYEKDTTPKLTLTQDGEEIHQGIELGITGKVTDNLTIIAGGTLIDLSVEKVEDKALEGKKPINAASKMAKLYSEYEISQIKGLAITGGAYYTGKSYGDRANKDVLPSYTLYDAGLRYKTKLDKYPTTFNLNVQNLTDEVYWTRNNMLGDPRSVAFSMKMEF